MMPSRALFLPSSVLHRGLRCCAMLLLLLLLRLPSPTSAGFFFLFFMVASADNSCNGAADCSALANLIRRDDCCQVDGINCNRYCRIENIHLASQNPPLNGSLPPSLSNLTSLISLNLSGNALTGHIPDFRSLSSLIILDLSQNNLTGTLLQAISSLNSTPLQYLNLSGNFFEGTLLENKPSLPSLQTISVRGNNLFGSFDPAAFCESYPGIRHLDFSCNHLEGNLSSGFRSCSHLQHLNLSFNKFGDPLPEDLFSLTSLESLCLQNNSFTGVISQTIGRLANLQTLNLGSNRLEGSIPETLANCTRLQVLDLGCNSLKGTIGGLDWNALQSLTHLCLNDNGFNGSIPDSLTNCTALQYLNLAKNQLSGKIPSGFEQLKKLTYLTLLSNNLDRGFEVLAKCDSLVSLFLTKNKFAGYIPENVTGFANLQVLACGNVGFQGGIPRWLRACAKLQVLDLSWNKLTGEIPSWLGDFPHLFYLDLSNNSLGGSIPPQIFDLLTLKTADLHLQGLQNVTNDLSIKRQNLPLLVYNQVLAFPPTVYLCNNRLHGSIPANVGHARRLVNLDLSDNNLTGDIPLSVADLNSLESLDLSRNKLSGAIPAMLASLTFLSFLNVSYNNLSGTIPATNQFSTFLYDSFKGNPSLCGRPLNNCNISSAIIAAAAVRRKSQVARLAVIVPLVVGLTAAAAAWGLFWTLSRRNAVYQRDDSSRYGGGSPKSLSDAQDLSVELFGAPRHLKVADLFGATNNFDPANIVGCGGFGLVYRADLADGTKVAIKKLCGDCGRVDREFRAEVEALSKAQHKNLVSLQGYFHIGNDRLLLYSYMENGSLDDWLHERQDGGGPRLDWPTRLKIAQGVAEGLGYLHQVCNPHIVHRDIKSSNILLDEDFEARLADFGLARLMMSTDTHVTTELVGTLGYIPPEYSQAFNATLRGDVYSFGVVLLELLTRKRPVDVCRARGAADLVEWILELRRENRVEEVFDALLRNKGHEDQMLQVLDVAHRCINPDPSQRPNIKEIIFWLSKVGKDNNSNSLSK